MLAPGLSAWNDYITVPEDADTLEVVGQQWTWSFRLPGEDGEFGAVSTKRIYDTPFGLDPDDPDSLDDILVDDIEIHLLLGQPVRMNLRSVDVLHDFYVPQFRAKMDMVPGMVTYFWLTPTRTGTFEILCAELCGIGHSDMRGYVIVDEEEDYRAWLAEQPTFAELLAEAGYDDQDRPTRLTSAGVDASATALKDEQNVSSEAARAAATR
jgi:cytochrome c oxidase subunit 2